MIDFITGLVIGYMFGFIFGLTTRDEWGGK